MSPQHGKVHAWLDRLRLRLRIAREDLLGSLYRHEESEAGEVRPAAASARTIDSLNWFQRFARRTLVRQGFIQADSDGETLTESGTVVAGNLVRSHRLWEAYMARHFDLPDDHLHATAEKVEHFLGPELQAELAAELDQPTTDPHGKVIPTPPDHL